MGQSQDPFPDAPSYEELESWRPTPEMIFEMEDGVRDWHDGAVAVAARIMVNAAREYSDYRDAITEDDTSERPALVESALVELEEHDKEAHTKLNQMELSMTQATKAWGLAVEKLTE